MKTRPSMLLGLLLMLGIGAYLDSPYSFINKNYAYSASEPVMARPIEQKEAEEPEIKEKLVTREKEDDGYIVETYREYDIYKDSNGKVIKTVPTDKEDTLKYWDYSKK